MTRLLLPCALLLLACVGASSAASGRPGAQGTPIVIGMIHADRRSDALAAARAAVEFVNTDRGGAAGRPLRLEACGTDGAPGSSSDCARAMVGLNVIAVAYDVDEGGEASVAVLERAGIPVVGATATSTTMLKAANAFVFNAGVGGSYAAMSVFAARNLATRKVALLTENDELATSAARAFGEHVLRAFGVRHVRIFPVDPSSSGLSATIRAVSASRPDVVIAAVPERSCAPIMQAIHSLAVRPRVVYSGTCLTPDLLQGAGGAAEEAYFETAVVPPEGANDPDLQTFRRALAQYGAGVSITPRSQTAFQSVMNFVDVVNGIGAPVTPGRLTTALRQSKGRPSFMGHPYTCDGRQAPFLPAVCDPHARVVQYRNGALIEVTGEWLNPF